VVDDLVYLSRAKLRRWVRPPGRLSGRVSGEVATPSVSWLPTAKVSLAGRQAPDYGGSGAEDYALLQRVLTQLDEQSEEPPRWVTDPVLAPQSYAYFEGLFRFGVMHADGQDPDAGLERMIFFCGQVGNDAEPVTLMLAGWVGHLVDEGDQHELSTRMGSGTQDIYRLWRQVVDRERAGDGDLPTEFGQFERPDVNGDMSRYERSARWAVGMAQHHLPHELAGRLEGVTEVHAVLSDRPGPGRLILGSPLYVARSHRRPPTPHSETDEAEAPSWQSRVAGLRRR
jgi:hypothetical protein